MQPGVPGPSGSSRSRCAERGWPTSRRGPGGGGSSRSPGCADPLLEEDRGKADGAAGAPSVRAMRAARTTRTGRAYHCGRHRVAARYLARHGLALAAIVPVEFSRPASGGRRAQASASGKARGTMDPGRGPRNPLHGTLGPPSSATKDQEGGTTGPLGAPREPRSARPSTALRPPAPEARIRARLGRSTIPCRPRSPP